MFEITLSTKCVYISIWGQGAAAWQPLGCTHVCFCLSTLLAQGSWVIPYIETVQCWVVEVQTVAVGAPGAVCVLSYRCCKAKCARRATNSRSVNTEAFSTKWLTGEALLTKLVAKVQVSIQPNVSNCQLYCTKNTGQTATATWTSEPTEAQSKDWLSSKELAQKMFSKVLC